MPEGQRETEGVSPVEASLTRTSSLRSTRSRSSGFLSNTLRRNHLLLLYAFAGFLLLRMWFFAFSRHDSKLISFCAFIMLLAAYIWWSRRGRLARQSRQAALVEQMVAEGRLPIVITQRRLNEEMGISAEGKEALKYFDYSVSAHNKARDDSAAKQQQEEADVEAEEAGLKDDRESVSSSMTPSAPSPPGAASVEHDVESGGVTGSGRQSSSTADEESGVTKEESSSGADPHIHIDQHCAVCLTDYEDGDRLCILPCLHCYHASCIEVWLENHSRCPLCNHDCNEVGNPVESSGTAAPAAAGVAGQGSGPSRSQ